MPADNETTTQFRADISELRAAMQEASRQVRLANSEFNAATAGMDDWTSSADGLSANITRLNSVLDAERSRMRSLERQYELTVEQYGENSRQAEELRIRMNQQQATVARTERELQNYESRLENVGRESRETTDSTESLISKLGGVAKGAIAGLGAAIGGLVTGLGAAVESSREWNNDMAKLEQNAKTSGNSFSAMKSELAELTALTGETDSSIEALSNLMATGFNDQQITEAVDALSGAVIKFPDTLKIESLADSLQETIKTGAGTGQFAELIERSGYSLDYFNEGLATCTTEAERQQYALAWLAESGLSEAAAEYEKANKGMLDYEKASFRLEDAIAQVGAAFTPVMATVKQFGADILQSFIPNIEKLASSFTDMINGVDGAGELFGQALSDIIMQALNKIVEMLPQVIDIGLSLITNLITGILSALPQLITVAIEIINTLLSGLTTAIPEIVTAVIEIVPKIIDALMQGLPSFIQAAIDFLMGIVQAIPTVIHAILVALPQIVTSIIDGLLKAFPQLLKGALMLLNALIDAIPIIVEQLVTALPTIVTAIVQGLITALPQLLNGAITFFMAIIQAIPVIVITLINQLPTIVMTIINVLIENIPLLLDAAITLFMAIVDAIPTIVTELLKIVPTIVTTIIDSLMPLIEDLGFLLGLAFNEFVKWGKDVIKNGKESASKFLKKVGEFLETLPYNLSKWFADALATVAGWVVDFVGKAKEAGKKFLDSVIQFVKNIPGDIAKFLTEALGKVVNWGVDLAKKGAQAAGDLFNSIVNKIKELPGEMLSIGSDLVEGLWNGINDMADWVSKKIKGFSDGVLDGIKDFFGIHSPSKVMKEEVGEPLAAGVAVGYSEGMKDTEKIVNKTNQYFVKSTTAKMLEEQEEAQKAAQKQEAEAQKARQKQAEKALKAFESIQNRMAKAYEDRLDSLTSGLTDMTKEFESTLSNIQNNIDSYKSKLTTSFQSMLTFDKDKDGNIIGAHATSEITDSTKELEEYLKLIEELRARGVSDNLINQLSSMSIEEGMATAKYYASRTDEQLRALEYNWNKYNETAQKLADELYADEIEHATSKYMTQVREQLAGQDAEMQKVGLELIQGLVSAFDVNSPMAQEKLTALTQGLNMMLGSLNDSKTVANAMSIGENLMLGIAEGFASVGNVAIEKIKASCNSIIDAAKETFDIHSPSRVMEKLIGNNLVFGLAEGIEGKAQTAVNAMKKLSNEILAPAQSALNGFNSGLSHSAGNAANASPVGNKTYNFYQTNTSPKALSRTEIYRQTKNQLAFAGGVK